MIPSKRRRPLPKVLVILVIIGSLQVLGMSQGRGVIGVLMVAGMFAIIGLLAWFWGVDVRDHRDWKD
jgi:hypothetical protein